MFEGERVCRLRSVSIAVVVGQESWHIVHEGRMHCDAVTTLRTGCTLTVNVWQGTTASDLRLYRGRHELQLPLDPGGSVLPHTLTCVGPGHHSCKVTLQLWWMPNSNSGSDINTEDANTRTDVQYRFFVAPAPKGAVCGTATMPNLRCPWCGVLGRDMYSLIVHLKRSHAYMDFSYTVCLKLFAPLFQLLSPDLN